MRKNKLDATKSILFSLVLIFVTTLIVYLSYIPDIKILKLAQMTSDRTSQSYESKAAELLIKEQLLAKTHDELDKQISMLTSHFVSDQFHKDSLKFFSEFDMTLVRSQVVDRYLVEEYVIEASLPDPRLFFEFIDFLATYKYLTEIEFPITIKSQENGILKMWFSVKIYAINQ